MADLVLEAIKPLGDRQGEEALALVILAARMFNDAEGSKQLLIWGLPDQAQPVTRDIIECSMLFRLFLQEPNRAKKWLMDFTEG